MKKKEISRRLGHGNKNIRHISRNTLGKKHEWKDNIIVPLRHNHRDITPSG
jgi:hypothetical protein